MKTITLAPRKTWVRLMLDSRRTHGTAITGCRTSSSSSPRCAASCCLHHGQIFLPNVSPETRRPHRIQFAIGLIKDYQFDRKHVAPDAFVRGRFKGWWALEKIADC